MRRKVGAFFRYSPSGWVAFGPWNSEGWAILMTVYFNGVAVILLAFVAVRFAYITFPGNLLLLGLVPLLVVFGNSLILSILLRQAHLELTRDRVILHLSRHWKMPIGLRDLHTIRIREYVVPKVYIFLWFGIGHKMDLYFISSPDLPWYFQFVGMVWHPTFIGRGFFITSWHENYELFLDKMKAYCATS